MYFDSGVTTPRFVNRIQSEVTQSSVKVSWSPPTTFTNEVIDVHHYYITYTMGWGETSRFDQLLLEPAETEFEVTSLEPNTYTLITIAAEFQGRFGPQVSIGISTSKGCMLTS